MFRVCTPFRFFLLILAMTGLCSRECAAQALATASRAADISVFGGFSPTYTDFGHRTYDGWMAGGDFRVFPPHWPVNPSLEFRYTHATNTPVTEQSYLGGIRFDHQFGRFTPYADVFGGVGLIGYHPVIIPGDTNDSGRNLAYGGGVDIDITRHVAVKLDFLQQNWNLGYDPAFAATGNYTLTPYQGTVGVLYHFSANFKDLHKQRELR
jgi:hypothetical protein